MKETAVKTLSLFLGDSTKYKDTKYGIVFVIETRGLTMEIRGGLKENHVRWNKLGNSFDK